MLRKTLIIYLGTAMLMGCSSRNPDIETLCQRDDIGNYVIKWETDPSIDGMLKIFSADDPETFSNPSPVLYADINDGVATYITKDRVTRKYFRLLFNDKYSRIVASRQVEMDSIQNFRDLGGYNSSHNHGVKWGKVFRSGDISAVSDWDNTRLDNLNMKTIIDLRSLEESSSRPVAYTKANIISIPVPIGGADILPSRISAGEMRKGDASLFMQDQYIQYIENDKELFAKALDVFLEEDNYPILFNCTLGKDRAGFLAMLLLSALDVPERDIIRDYVASNDYIDIRPFARMASGLSLEAQETMTILLSSNESLMNFVLEKIKKDYGSMDKYLSNELNFTEKKQTKLKELLLY